MPLRKPLRLNREFEEAVASFRSLADRFSEWPWRESGRRPDPWPPYRIWGSPAGPHQARLAGERLLLWSGGRREERALPLSAAAVLAEEPASTASLSEMPALGWAWQGWGWEDGGGHYVVLCKKGKEAGGAFYAWWREESDSDEAVTAHGGSFELPAFPAAGTDAGQAEACRARGWAWWDGEEWSLAVPATTLKDSDKNEGGFAGLFRWRAANPAGWKEVEPVAVEAPGGGRIVSCRAGADGRLWVYVVREGRWFLAHSFDDGSWTDVAELGAAPDDRVPGLLLPFPRPERPGWCGFTDASGPFGLETSYFECEVDGTRFAFAPLGLRHGKVEAFLAQPEERWLLWREPGQGDEVEAAEDEVERAAAEALRPVRALCWRPRRLLSESTNFCSLYGLDYVERAAKRHAAPPKSAEEKLCRALLPPAWQYWLEHCGQSEWFAPRQDYQLARSLLIVPDGCERMAELSPGRPRWAVVLGESEFAAFERSFGLEGILFTSIEIRIDSPDTVRLTRRLCRGRRIEREDEIAAQRTPTGEWKLVLPTAGSSLQAQ